MSLKSIIDSMVPGDVLENAKTGATSLMLIRRIDANKMVIGKFSDDSENGLLLNELFNDVYEWSDVTQSLVDGNGEIPTWWTKDIYMSPAPFPEFAEFAERMSCIPISDDYPSLSESEIDEITDRNNREILRAAGIIRLGPDEGSSFRRVLELIGIEMTDEQNILLKTVLALGQIKKISQTLGYDHSLIVSNEIATKLEGALPAPSKLQ